MLVCGLERGPEVIVIEDESCETNQDERAKKKDQGGQWQSFKRFKVAIS